MPRNVSLWPTDEPVKVPLSRTIAGPPSKATAPIAKNKALKKIIDERGDAVSQ
jgi:hypothetical protein